MQSKNVAQETKKLSAIVGKLWGIMRVNYLLLTAALICMVSASCVLCPCAVVVHLHGLFGRPGLMSCSTSEACTRVQAVAALSELAIPHFTTATIFSVAQGGSDVKFYANVKLLAVGNRHAHPSPGTRTRRDLAEGAR